MSTAASPVSVAPPAPRPAWGRSLLGALAGVIVGGPASAAIVGAAALLAARLGGEPVPDAIGNALAPLSWFALVPVGLAVAADAALRREAFRRVTGWRPSAGTAVWAAVLAPAAAAGVGWRGVVVAWVLGASTVLLRCCAVPVPAPPPRPVVLLAACAIALPVAAAGLLALQLATPAVAVSRVPGSPHRVEIAGRGAVGVTVLGIDGPLGDVVRLGGPLPMVIHQGEGRGITLLPARACRRGGAAFSALDLRYRVLGVERVSSLDLGGEIRIRC